MGYFGSYFSYFGALDSFGDASLTVSSPPQSFIEPISLEEAKAFLKVPTRFPPDADEDALIQSMISAARARAEVEHAIDLVQKQIDLVYDFWPPYRVELGSPLVSVDLVQYRDYTGSYTSLVENVHYLVDKSKQPGILTPLYASTWPSFSPWPASAILFRFTTGVDPAAPFWSDLGAHIKIGMRLLISEWYNNRLSASVPRQDYLDAATSLLSYGSRPRAR